MAYVHTVKKTMKGIVSYCAKRNEQIWKFRQKGWTLSDLAEKYHITEQRVGQIVAQMERASRKARKFAKAG